MIDRHWETRDEGHDDDRSPWSFLPVCSNDAVHKSIADLILDLGRIKGGGCDEELVLDAVRREGQTCTRWKIAHRASHLLNKVLAHLYSLEVCILDGMLDLGRGSKTPRAGRPQDLCLTSADEPKFGKFLRSEVRRWNKEGHDPAVILDTKQVIPSLHEVTAQVSCWLANDLKTNIVPRHARELVTREQVFLRL